MTHSPFALLLPGLLAGAFAVGAQAQTAPAQPAQALQTPAGTEITNQATATFEPLAPGGAASAQSNIVRTVVQAVCAVSVSPNGTVQAPGQSATLLPGEGATFAYTVVNSGNDRFSLPLTARTEVGSAHAPTTRLVLDANGNGVADPREGLVGTLTLEAGASAKVLLVVQAADSAEGDAFVNLVASCGGLQDADNVSRVRVGAPPVLAVRKSFSPALLRPGTETTVTVTTRNQGRGDSREVVLTDLLGEQIAQGLEFVPGSARASAGILEYTSDGVAWGTGEAAGVRGLRVRAASLAAGAELTLTFRMRATEAAENRSFLNVATAATGRQQTQGTASADVRYQPGVAIGPVGEPEAPENTPADTQTRPFAVVGQEVCFDHTLKNTGDVRDLFTVTVTYPQGAATARLTGADGAALAQPLPLDPGATALVRVCYDAAQAGGLEALITAAGTRGTRNTTRDVIQAVEAGLPDLVKTVSPGPGETVSQGDELTYTLQVRNPYTRPLTGVTVLDPLPGHVDFVETSAGGTVTGELGRQTVTWTVGTLAPGETRTFTVRARVSPRAVDGEALRNVFNLVSTELPTPLPSNEVQSPVWSAALRVSKAVSSAQAAPGDRLTYTLRIQNLSATTAIVNAVVTDTPARGLSYLPGTSRLGGQPLADPTVTNGALRWAIGTLPAGGTLELTYQTRVSADAAGELVNRVEVAGDGAGGNVRAIASNVATAVTRLKLGAFAPLADLLGTVYVDRNRNGLFDEGFDTPVERARVILAGGRLALTDAAGRYHFAQVPLGTHALRLDPGSAPYPPLSVPQDGGLPGTRTVHVRGLTGVDFPLAPLTGEVMAVRRSTLAVGELSIEKTMQATAGGYRVTLRLVSASDLADFELHDALPTGAVLKEGRHTLSGTLKAGETLLTYDFTFTGGMGAAMTDPAVRWRN
ncbi:conserved repeat domain-containing protein [Deinococcus reticulitermitis]|uniref:Conserved repeat domain-containing protein n=1 Tax=Deinococcus reticulitermitis TaxID=856736 RepID=A0A1H6YY96_9DEIO|nr:DUF11 domain-containing protein [Deinococcus reticulitermitis]SEJ44057.1 conserved repeat domain-containing protein [Deinococcus reticulitermitis]